MARPRLFWKVKSMKNNQKSSQEQTDTIQQTVMENLHLTAKKAASFAKQARALQKNLALRKRQKEAREARQDAKLQTEQK